MNDRPHIPDVPDLGRRRAIEIKTWHVVLTAGIIVTATPVAHFDGEYSLVLLDMANVTGHIVPYTRQALEALHDKIAAVLDGDDEELTEGE